MSTKLMTDAANLVELANRMHNNVLMEIADNWRSKNPFFQLFYFEEASDYNQHEGLRAGHLPGGTWRDFNQGIKKDNATTVPFNERIGMLENLSEADLNLARRSGDPARYRAQNIMLTQEGMLRNLVNKLFYGNRAADKSFDGLAVRYGLDNVYGNVHANGGSGANHTSAWVVSVGPRKVTMVYPKSHPSAGIESEDLDIQMAQDEAGDEFPAWVDWCKVHLGLSIYDHRCIQRVPGINNAADATVNLIDPDVLDEAIVSLPNMGADENTYILLNRTTYRQLKSRAKDRINVTYNPNQPWGNGRMIDYDGTQLLVFDGIATDEVAEVH